MGSDLPEFGAAVGVGVAVFALVMTAGMGALMFWGIFAKARIPRWHSLIPIYQWVQVSRVAGKPSWWGWLVGIPQVLPLLLIPVMFQSLSQWTIEQRSAPTMPPGFGLMALTYPLSMAAFVFQILIAIGVARAFGKTDGWAVGLILLGFVFYPIIGFGSSIYYGPQGPGSTVPPPPAPPHPSATGDVWLPPPPAPPVS